MKINYKNNLYFLVKDILSSFSGDIEQNLIHTLNSHFISKEATRNILKDEIKEKVPRYKILRGALIIQNDLLRKLPSSAIYEVSEVMAELKYCFKIDKRKTIKRLSAQVILRLFASLYFEFIIMPLGDQDTKLYLNKFKKYFSKSDLITIFSKDFFYARYIFKGHGIELGTSDEAKAKLKKILNKFYRE